MAEAAVARGREQVKGILSLERVRDLFKEGLEDIKRRHEEKITERQVEKETIAQQKAESRYDKVRNKLIYASAGYSKDAIESYNKIFAELNKLTPAEKKEFSDLISSGVRSADAAGANAQKYTALFDAIGDGVKAKVITWEKSTFMLETMINAGISAIKVTGYAASFLSENPWLGPIIDVGVSTLKHGLFKVINQANKKGEVASVLKDDKLMEAVQGIEKDINTLNEELNNESGIWIEKAKQMKPKEFEQAFGKYMQGKIKELNLENISARLLGESLEKGHKKGKDQTTDEKTAEEPAVHMEENDNAPANENEGSEPKKEDLPKAERKDESTVPSETLTDEIMQEIGG